MAFLKKQQNVQAVECFRLYLEIEPECTHVRGLLSKALHKDGVKHIGGSQVPGKLSGVREALAQ